MMKQTVPGVDMGQRVMFLIFYGALGCCLWFWVDVGLIYHGGGVIRRFPSFYWGWDFFRASLSYPGGLSAYLAALIAQSLFHSWLGALVLTVQAALIHSCMRAWLTALGSPRLGWLGFGASLILLALYSGYAHFSEPITALAVAALVAQVGLRGPFSSPVPRAAIMTVLGLGLYLAAGGAFLVLLIPWAVLEKLKHSPFIVKALPIVLVPVAPLVLGRFVYGLGSREAFESLLPIVRGPDFVLSRGMVLLFALCSFVPLASLLALHPRFADRHGPVAGPQAASSPRPPPAPPTIAAARKPGEKLRATSKPANPVIPRRTLSYRAQWFLKATALGSALLAVMAAAHDRHLHTELLVDYYCWHRDWPQALAAARPNTVNPHVAAAAAQAAFHTGTLLWDLPPNLRPDDLLLFDEGLPGDWRKSDLYFDLGYANMALHFLTESVETCGERPILLERLATVNLALGNLETAKIFLNLLTRCPFHSRQARDSLARLDADPTLAQDDEVQRLRSWMPRRDSVLRPRTKETFLLLVQANPQNRMAFEYLMSYYLLSKDLDGFVQHIPLADAFAGFARSPLWDEALALAAKRSTRPLSFKAGTISPDAERRLDAMTRAIRAFEGNSELARTSLRAEYEKTYFYYYFFHP